MCGVVGFIGGQADRDERIAAIRRGIRAIVHRGPEEVGYYTDPHLTLGTVRLSIVDLLLGKQPMMTADRRFIVGFNGEIFNYLELRDELHAAGIRFVTRSDTEVLLHSLAYWGVDEALTRLNGQFGFAFYDRLRRRLVLGRDPFGERPMYYASDGGVCYFASEVKGIFAFPQVRRVLDADRVLAASRFWAPVPDETCFAGVQCLPQGHYLTACDGRVEVTKYYHGFEAGRGTHAGSELTFAEGVSALRDVLRESVRLRLRGDYPLGAFVSGGLDSAVVVATMGELWDERIRTFSIRVDDPRVDEGRQQEAVVEALGLNHTEVLVRAADVRARFPKVVEQCEVPLHRAAPVACGMLAEHVGQSGVRIVLGGEGADELFLGYDIVKEASVVEECLRERSFHGGADRLERVLHDLRHTAEVDGDQILRFYRDRIGDGHLALGAHLRRFDTEPLTSLFRTAHGVQHADRRLRTWIRGQAPDFERWSLVDRAQWLDIHTLFIGYGMTCHGDRPGTGCGVETRFPFLDPAVVALASRLPWQWKLHELRREKHILREAYRDALPPAVLDRPKFGMRIPGASALLPGDSDDWVRGVLSPASLRASEVLHEPAVRELVQAVTRHRGGTVPYPLSHTYLQVLSILLLDQLFVRDFRVPDTDIDRILFRTIDGEAEPIGAEPIGAAPVSAAPVGAARPQRGAA